VVHVGLLLQVPVLLLPLESRMEAPEQVPEVASSKRHQPTRPVVISAWLIVGNNIKNEIAAAFKSRVCLFVCLFGN